MKRNRKEEITIDSHRIEIEEDDFEIFQYDPDNRIPDRYNYIFSEIDALDNDQALSVFNFIKYAHSGNNITDCADSTGIYDWTIKRKFELVLFLDKYFDLFSDKDYCRMLYMGNCGKARRALPPLDSCSGIVMERVFSSFPSCPQRYNSTTRPPARRKTLVKIVDSTIIKEIYLSSPHEYTTPQTITIDASVFREGSILPEDYIISSPSNTKEIVLTSKLFLLLQSLLVQYTSEDRIYHILIEPLITFYMEKDSVNCVEDYVKLFEPEFSDSISFLMAFISTRYTDKKEISNYQIRNIGECRSLFKPNNYPLVFKTCNDNGHVLVSSKPSGPINREQYIDFIRGSCPPIETEVSEIIQID